MGNAEGGYATIDRDKIVTDKKYAFIIVNNIYDYRIESKPENHIVIVKDKYYDRCRYYVGCYAINDYVLSVVNYLSGLIYRFEFDIFWKIKKINDVDRFYKDVVNFSEEDFPNKEKSINKWEFDNEFIKLIEKMNNLDYLGIIYFKLTDYERIYLSNIIKNKKLDTLIVDRQFDCKYLDIILSSKSLKNLILTSIMTVVMNASTMRADAIDSSCTREKLIKKLKFENRLKSLKILQCCECNKIIDEFHNISNMNHVLKFVQIFPWSDRDIDDSADKWKFYNTVTHIKEFSSPTFPHEAFVYNICVEDFSDCIFF